MGLKADWAIFLYQYSCTDCINKYEQIYYYSLWEQVLP